MPLSKGLAIYLNDHLAGSVAGAELADKIAEQYADTPMGRSLAALAGDINKDKATLETLLDRLGIESRLSMWRALVEVVDSHPAG